jgi:hypothetical protein
LARLVLFAPLSRLAVAVLLLQARCLVQVAQVALGPWMGWAALIALEASLAASGAGKRSQHYRRKGLLQPLKVL